MAIIWVLLLLLLLQRLVVLVVVGSKEGCPHHHQGRPLFLCKATRRQQQEWRQSRLGQQLQQQLKWHRLQCQ
jgi:hypothetical protein